jgi:hypothetical protein
MIPDARALLDVNTHYVTNQPNSQNDGALPVHHSGPGHCPPALLVIFIRDLDLDWLRPHSVLPWIWHLLAHTRRGASRRL